MSFQIQDNGCHSVHIHHGWLFSVASHIPLESVAVSRDRDGAELYHSSHCRVPWGLPSVKSWNKDGEV